LPLHWANERENRKVMIHYQEEHFLLPSIILLSLPSYDICLELGVGFPFQWPLKKVLAVLLKHDAFEHVITSLHLEFIIRCVCSIFVPLWRKEQDFFVCQRQGWEGVGKVPV